MQQSGEQPLCRSGKSCTYIIKGHKTTFEGCPIQREAQSPLIARLIVGFTQYKQLNHAKAPESLQIEALEKAGARHLCPEFLAALEPVHAQYMNSLQENARKEAERKRKERERVEGLKKKARSM